MKTDINNLIKSVLLYTLSFSTGLLLITYFLQVPHLVTGNRKIVNEYYNKNFLKNVPLDYLFVLIYLLVSYLFIELLKLKTVAEQVLAVGLTTAILTFGFCYYFTSNPQTPNFFSKWFHTVGYSSIIYDVILLVVIFLIYKYLQENTN